MTCALVEDISLKGVGNVYAEQDNPLIGSWGMTERLVDEDGVATMCTDTYTFYRNGGFKWKESVDGHTIFVERGTYTISGDRLSVHYSQRYISEEALFCIIDNKVSLRFEQLEAAIILTKL